MFTAAISASPPGSLPGCQEPGSCRIDVQLPNTGFVRDPAVGVQKQPPDAKE
jgi:hypothetical protein